MRRFVQVAALLAACGALAVGGARAEEDAAPDAAAAACAADTFGSDYVGPEPDVFCDTPRLVTVAVNGGAETELDPFSFKFDTIADGRGRDFLFVSAATGSGAQRISVTFSSNGAIGFDGSAKTSDLTGSFGATNVLHPALPSTNFSSGTVTITDVQRFDLSGTNIIGRGIEVTGTFSFTVVDGDSVQYAITGSFHACK